MTTTSSRDVETLDGARWKPESLLDAQLATSRHVDLLKFLGMEREASFPPSEIKIGAQVPDRVFWKGNDLHILDLKVRVQSRTCGELEVKHAVGLLYYIHNVPLSTEYGTKYEMAINHVKTTVFSVFHPSTAFQKLLERRSFQYLSIEHGFCSQQPLDPTKAALPLVIADLRARVRRVATGDPDARALEDSLLQVLEVLVARKYRPEEKLFIQRYPFLLEFTDLHHPELTHHVMKLKEVTELCESEMEHIVKENLYLLSPEERLKGLKPEERLKGLKPEDEVELLRLLLARRKRPHSEDQ